ncbi:carbohydrate ABC transporter permease [Sphaerisporangium sp. TRM90804]|uniref:carbohydrate ABC transporter permease n=1 Tax=Sphaerisporangium sp. TRM90804 TaxID=3031113 RepID=UPI002446F4D4|nr:carbohydrate ABC transporter permease [Sphaerisporangium sp. TRM90804]MDH2430451.1 carbohydrate ABC transporter permease [Sphaerisporangium sp. TRM90804]
MGLTRTPGLERPPAAKTEARRPRAGGGRPRRTGGEGRNWLGGITGWLWLAIVIVPIYWIFITSFKAQSSYYATNPLVPPAEPTFDNYKLVVESDFPLYFLNSLIVTVGAVVPAVLISFMAAYAIVRGGGAFRFLRGVNALFLMGLAIPLQATIIPIYLIIIRMRLYDSLTGLILPSIAFAIPLSVLVLTNFIRDVPKELFESMRIDGASEFMTLWRLAWPLTLPAVVTVTIYNALTIWNGFLLPLILTQSADKRTLPLALWTFQGQYSVNVPAVLASVVLTALPILFLYVVGRRQLLSGLTAGFGK